MLEHRVELLLPEVPESEYGWLQQGDEEFEGGFESGSEAAGVNKSECVVG